MDSNFNWISSNCSHLNAPLNISGFALVSFGTVPPGFCVNLVMGFYDW